MAKFSVGRDDDGDEGGSRSRPNPNPNPNPKRMRLLVHQQEPEIEQFVEGEEEDEGGERETSGEEEEEEEVEQELSSVEAKDDVAMVGDVAEEEGCHVMTLSDPDVLDCPICLDPLTIPVFQCENGHVACSSCSTKVKSKCPSCAFPIGYNRCRAIEKVIESIKITCRNFKYGCIEKIRYFNKNEHENTCAQAPCSCPQPDCTYIGSSKQLCTHFTSKHIYSATLFDFGTSFSIRFDASREYQILREKGGRLFILNNRDFNSLGNMVSVSCLQPITSKEVFLYYVVARKDGCVLKLESVAADNVIERAENPDQKKFLMVPREFLWRNELRLEVNILDQQPHPPPSVVFNP